MANRDYYGTENPELWKENTTNDTSNKMSTAISDPTIQSSDHLQTPQNMSYEQQQQQQQQLLQSDLYRGTDPQMPQESERGLGATVVGATGGAFLGHKFAEDSGHGTLGTIGGGVAGALLANAVESVVRDCHGGHHHHERHDRVRERLERRLDRLG
ncbi:conserved hypothetical protein [Talaromyces stipitatus ATCC 10500]|uniref:Glycine zipper 2TM domain-containing protein n=1 Tax=Talaromyces stipitatus (strain ATCC 10500 / CBS 375.48 / QM 6759 / NRRL 1006) TaxID=441959 RepID=B8MFE2_TALSN|nr:uncharacterized protein TSTA_017510 [Talaromyces stipitatus ATCC 10500]EED16676.1 conserved hypothetical protein [Talaromyces stipitatus ATCC 10500]